MSRSTTEQQRRYRTTGVGKAKVRVTNRAQRYALQQLKLAHPVEYEKHRQEYLAAHPLPRGMGSGHPIDYGATA